MKNCSCWFKIKKKIVSGIIEKISFLLSWNHKTLVDLSKFPISSSYIHNSLNMENLVWQQSELIFFFDLQFMSYPKKKNN